MSPDEATSIPGLDKPQRASRTQKQDDFDDSRNRAYFRISITIRFCYSPMEFEPKLSTVEKSKPYDAIDKVHACFQIDLQIKAVDWNCDGSLFAFGGKDRSITVWNPKHVTVVIDVHV